jgi:hypothetical protein
MGVEPSLREMAQPSKNMQPGVYRGGGEGVRNPPRLKVGVPVGVDRNRDVLAGLGGMQVQEQADST